MDGETFFAGCKGGKAWRKPDPAAELSCFVHELSSPAAELSKFLAESSSPRAESSKFAAPARKFPAPSTSPAAPAGKFLHEPTSPRAESTSPAAESSRLWTVSHVARFPCLIFGHGGRGPTPRWVGMGALRQSAPRSSGATNMVRACLLLLRPTFRA